ncbi:hypothetical protein QTP70_004174 [Hemibagrus guttatus]|uniref:Uncharacterized protein n=1 Tax=Hemibagrus guttatus TaxID=175788 RepID=A0AAE0RFP7_9TELE|nr:hypothetical protein QTP70_004174 [Hemibagrus guttatus]
MAVVVNPGLDRSVKNSLSIKWQDNFHNPAGCDQMGKFKNLSDFDKSQIVMLRRLDQNISKRTGLVGCSQYAVVSIYQKWSNEEQTVVVKLVTKGLRTRYKLLGSECRVSHDMVPLEQRRLSLGLEHTTFGSET